MLGIVAVLEGFCWWLEIVVVLRMVLRILLGEERVRDCYVGRCRRRGRRRGLGMRSRKILALKPGVPWSAF